MKMRFVIFPVIALGALALAGCATKPKPPAEAEASSIQAEASGLSPSGDARYKKMSFDLVFGSSDYMGAWTVEIAEREQNRVVRTIRGDKTHMPRTCEWDGTTDSGQPAPEGTYIAFLSVDYSGKSPSGKASSKPFILDLTPPSGSFAANPPLFSLSADRGLDPIAIDVVVKPALAKVASWDIAVSDPSGNRVKDISANLPTTHVEWDGKTDSGSFLSGASQYPATLTVVDEFGNKGSFSGSFSVAAALVGEAGSIDPSRGGFSPAVSGDQGTIDLLIRPKAEIATSSWSVGIYGENQGGVLPIRSFEGATGEPPQSVRWDGRDEAGKFVPDGSYYALLSLGIGGNPDPLVARSRDFLVVATPPTGTISLSADVLAQGSDNGDCSESISLSGSSGRARVAEWTLTARDPDDNPFREWKGTWPADPILWNGRGEDGDLPESVSDYSLVLKLKDEFGNVGTTVKSLPTDLMLIKSGEGYSIRMSGITFKPFSADYEKVSSKLAKRNLEVLDLLAAKLNEARLVDYKVRIEGHAVMINWDNKVKSRIEQRDVLIPLSVSRAEAVKAALVARGVKASRLVISAKGADDPLVPDSDRVNRWQNRRVDFYLEK